MKAKGFRGFLTIWLGQFVSLFGSGMTSFALTIWVYQQTESPTALSITGFFWTIPMLIYGPIGGALADRLPRKLLLIVSDTMAGLASLGLLLVYQYGNLEMWHIYTVVFVLGVADSIQVPALMSSITMLVSKRHISRANGMQELASTASSIFSPIAAAGLLAFTDIKDILLLDLLTFSIALITLAITQIPQPKRTDVGSDSRGNFLQDVVFGFRFILARPSFRGLQLLWMSANLIGTMSSVLISHLVLARTGNNELVLSYVEAIMSGGAVMGGLIISIWGGPKKKIQGALICMALSSILGRMAFSLGRDFVSWIPGAFFMFFFIPILNGALAPIWHSKIPPDVQGRVMSVRITASRAMIPLGNLLAGPLAEKIFEPMMQTGGALCPLFGKFLGTGPGAGMSLLIFFSGFLMLCLTPIGLLIPAIRDAESLLPDYDPGIRS